MKRTLLFVLIIIVLFTNARSQDSLYTNFSFSPFDDYSGDVNAGGDLNGDGYDDLIITDSHRNIANIYFGGSDFDTIPDMSFSRDDFDFWIIAYNGDLNNDGFDDLVISYANYGGEPWGGGYGRILIFLGSTNFDLEPDYDLCGNNYNHGYSTFSYYFGTDIDISADYNNDGYNDLTVYTPGYDGTAYGFVHVFNGGAEFDTLEDNFFAGDELSRLFTSRRSIGDINGDGCDELAVSYLVDPLYSSQRAIKIYPGSPDGLSNIEVSSFLISTSGIVISSDFNGDGYNDIFMPISTTILRIGYGNENYEFDNYQNILIEGQYSSYLDGIDFDKDGFDDLILRKTGYNTEIYVGSESGLCQEPGYGRSGTGVLYFIGKVAGIFYPSLLNRVEGDDFILGLLTLEDLETIIDNDNLELEIRNYELKQNYPNPFNPITKINYELRITDYELAVIVIDNALGQQVWSQNLLTDHTQHVTGTIFFDGSKFNSGVYYYSLIVDGKRMDTKAMILTK